MPRRQRSQTAPEKQAQKFDPAAEDGRWKRASNVLFDPRFWLVLVLALFIGTRLWRLMAFDVMGADTVYYANFARQGIDENKVAYRDFELEYPPVAWWLIAMPRIVDSKRYRETNPTRERVDQFFGSYFWSFRAELVLADTMNLLLMFLIGRRLLPKAPWLLPGAYSLLTIGQPHLLYDRLDIGLTLFFLLFIECWLRSIDESRSANRWATLSYLFLGLGISYKIMPLIFVPYLLLADVWRAGSVWKFAGRVLALAVAALGPFLVYVPSAGWGVLNLFKYHSERGTHLESIWSSIMLVAGKFGVPCSVYYSHGGYNLAGDWDSTLRIVSRVAIVGVAGSIGLWALLRGRRYDRRLALDTAILVLVDVTVLSHVYSPQYLNWLMPLALLLAVNIVPRNWVIWSVFVVLVAAIVGASSWLYPYHYLEQFTELKKLPVDVSIARSACLVGLALLLTTSFFRKYGLLSWRAARAGGS